jgi:methylated-DNA-[protein]-cysteine S-methyltransferase
MIELRIDKMDSVIGEIVAIVEANKLCALDFGDYEVRMLSLLQKRYQQFELKPVVNPVGWRDRLQAYFNGDYTSLDAITVNTGGTSFQQQVWAALRTIPVGQVISYGKLATQIGKPNASRAVGMANSLNPVAIVLPCHRVIGANASLTGYAGGLERKRWLLQHEGVNLTKRPSVNDQQLQLQLN